MPERPGAGTIGGAVAAGISSLRRGRLYATRERVLEVTMVTGDGRTVRSGGRVVKNVTGYDLHRLAVGAFGSLGRDRVGLSQAVADAAGDEDGLRRGSPSRRRRRPPAVDPRMGRAGRRLPPGHRGRSGCPGKTGSVAIRSPGLEWPADPDR